MRWSSVGLLLVLTTPAFGQNARRQTDRPDELPKAIHQVLPDYPKDAKKAHITGVVEIRVKVARDGTVEAAHAVSGPPELADAAIDAAKQWKYEPRLSNGQPIEFETTIPMAFQLADRTMTFIAATVLIHYVQPRYPKSAKRAHIQGTIILHAVIAEDGTVQQLEYVSGPPELSDAAMKAAEQWKYVPPRFNGRPVEVDTTISFVFALPGIPASQ